MKNKTHYVRDYIFQEILKGKYIPGSKLPSEVKMAEITNTSRITTRRAFAELEQNGIIQRIHGRGTFVATSLAGNSRGGKHVALLTTLNDPFALDFIAHLEQELTNNDLLLTLKITDNDALKEKNAAIKLVAAGIRNLIIWPRGSAISHDTFLRLRVLGTNIVFFDRIFPGESADYVGLNHKAAVISLLQDAVSRSYKDFIFINYKGLQADSNKIRQKTFETYCLENNLSFRIEFVEYESSLEPQIKSFRNLHFSKTKKSAVICVNDTVAIAARNILGSKPAIYGIDGFPEAIEKNIITVKQPLSRMAKKTIQCLQKQHEQGSAWKAKKIFIKGKIITPESNHH